MGSAERPGSPDLRGIALLDPAALDLLRAQLDEESVREVVGLFLEGLPGRRDTVLRALAEGDEAAARAEAHRTGSSAALVGATRLHHWCRLLEGPPGERPADAPQAWQAACDATGAALAGWLDRR